MAEPPLLSKTWKKIHLIQALEPKRPLISRMQLDFPLRFTEPQLQYMFNHGGHGGGMLRPTSAAAPFKSYIMPANDLLLPMSITSTSCSLQTRCCLQLCKWTPHHFLRRSFLILQNTISMKSKYVSDPERTLVRQLILHHQGARIRLDLGSFWVSLLDQKCFLSIAELFTRKI